MSEGRCPALAACGVGRLPGLDVAPEGSPSYKNSRSLAMGEPRAATSSSPQALCCGSRNPGGGSAGGLRALCRLDDTPACGASLRRGASGPPAGSLRGPVTAHVQSPWHGPGRGQEAPSRRPLARVPGRHLRHFGALIRLIVSTFSTNFFPLTRPPDLCFRPV